MRLQRGQPAPRLRMIDVEGNVVMLGSTGSPTLLCFFGDAACAFCNVYLCRLLQHYPALARRGLTVEVVFNATQEAVWRFVSARPRPFPVIADRTGVAHRAYRIERSMWGKFKAIVTHTPTWLKGLRLVGFAGLNFRDGMPADFLLDTNGRIVEAHYGGDTDDHIPFARIDAFADDSRASEPGRPSSNA